MKKIVALLFTLVLLSTPAFADGWNDDLKAKVQNDFLHSFDGIKEKDIDKLMAQIPEGVLIFLQIMTKCQ